MCREHIQEAKSGGSTSCRQDGEGEEEEETSARRCNICILLIHLNSSNFSCIAKKLLIAYSLLYIHIYTHYMHVLYCIIFKDSEII